MTDPGSSRRDFIKRSSKAGIAVLTAGGLGFWLRSRSEHPQQEVSASGLRDYRVDVSRPIPDMVVASDGSPEDITKAAINALGGMETFVSRGDVVVLKPNIGWDRVPQQAANTNPEVVKTVAELCFNAGAKKVVVTDVSCNEPRRCFRRSGIAKAAESVGATVILPEERKFRDIRINGEALTGLAGFHAGHRGGQDHQSAHPEASQSCSSHHGHEELVRNAGRAEKPTASKHRRQYRRPLDVSCVLR